MDRLLDRRLHSLSGAPDSAAGGVLGGRFQRARDEELFPVGLMI